MFVGGFINSYLLYNPSFCWRYNKTKFQVSKIEYFLNYLFLGLFIIFTDSFYARMHSDDLQRKFENTTCRNGPNEADIVYDKINYYVYFHFAGIMICINNKY